MAQEPTSQDLVATAIGRIITQYKGKPKLQGSIEATVQTIQELDDCALQIPPLYDIDVATGVNLDMLGKLVGQSRVLVNGSTVTDEQLRLLIRARIARNATHATGEEMIAQLALIFSGAHIELYDWEMMSIGYAIGRVLTSDEVAVLQTGILPKPMGVSIVPSEFYDPNDFFGFAEDPDPHAAGLGDDSSGTTVGGGTLATEF